MFKQKLDSDYIKHSINPLDFYRHELAHALLKKHGWNDGGLCPFHADKKPGSFKINTETGAFLCFSCRIKGSDVIAFTMHLYGLTFADALKKISSDWGVYD
jgi:DNA primase